MTPSRSHSPQAPRLEPWALRLDSSVCEWSLGFSWGAVVDVCGPLHFGMSVKKWVFRVCLCLCEWNLRFTGGHLGCVHGTLGSEGVLLDPRLGP